MNEHFKQHWFGIWFQYRNAKRMGVFELTVISMIFDWLSTSHPFGIWFDGCYLKFDIWKEGKNILTHTHTHTHTYIYNQKDRKKSRNSNYLFRWKNFEIRMNLEKVIFMINDPITYWKRIRILRGFLVPIFRVFITIYAPDGGRNTEENTQHHTQPTWNPQKIHRKKCVKWEKKM